MPDKKQTWRLIVKKTGEVVIKSDKLDDRQVLSIKAKSLDLIKKEEDSKYQIQYFEDYLFKGADELSVYFS